MFQTFSTINLSLKEDFFFQKDIISVSRDDSRDSSGLDTLIAQGVTIYGTMLSEELQGTSGNDSLFGLGGNDFNNDGFCDLAIGVLAEATINNDNPYKEIYVFFGTKDDDEKDIIESLESNSINFYFSDFLAELLPFSHNPNALIPENQTSIIAIDYLNSGGDNLPNLVVTSESTDSGSITVITLQDESTSPVINGTSGDDNLLGDQYSNLIKGFRDINWLRDKAKEDILIGEQDDNLLLGSKQNGILRASKGDDTLRGSSDNNILIGDTGEDVLVLENNQGIDLIRDFADSVDSFGLLGDWTFHGLNISNNLRGTPIIIRDHTNNRGMGGSQLALDNSAQIALSSTVTATDKNSFASATTVSEYNFSENIISEGLSDFSTNITVQSEMQTLPEVNSSSSTLNGEIILQVNTLADIVNGSDNYLSLREAISLATVNSDKHYRIELQSGQRYEMSLPFNGNLRIVNGSNITIDSVGGEENAIIDASAVSNGVFYVNNSTLNLEGITVTGGSFDGFLAKGGSFFVSRNGEVNLTDSEVTNSSAGYRGGAFYVKEGIVTLNNSRVSNSVARDGGAFALVEEGFSQITLNLNNSVIEDSNSTNGNGGAIFAIGGVEIYIDGSVFENNQSINGLGGGAIHTQGENIESAILEINDTTFVNNVAHKSDLGAGSVYAQQATVMIADSLFDNNNVTESPDTRGGAIFFNEFTSGEIKKTDFIGNGNPDINGGAIATFNRSNLILDEVDFTRNEGNRGGAIQLLGDNNTLTNVKFIDNTAQKAGGAWFGSKETTLNNIDFINNESEKENGSAAIIADEESSWTNILLQENKAIGNGTLAITAGNHNFTEITALNNQASSGGVYFVAPQDKVTLDVNKSLLENNIARDNGGVMYAHATSLPAEINLQEIEAKDNHSGLLAGAFHFVDRVSAKVTKSVLSGNSAAFKGGALSVYGAEVDVIDTLFDDNSAIKAGAIEVWFGLAHPLRGELNLLNSFVHNNRSTLGDAGAILVGPGADMSIANSIIAFNESAKNASAIELFTSLELIPEPTLTIINSSILANKNGTGAEGAGVFVVGGSEGEPILGNLPRFAGDLYLYNTLIDGTIAGNGEAILDYDGDAPINANNNLIGSINNMTGFDSSNLLNVDSEIILPENGNYTITADSPLVENGDNNFLPADIFDLNDNGNQQELLPIDILTGDRIQGEQVDIGAIEFNPTPVDNSDINGDREYLLADSFINPYCGTTRTPSPESINIGSGVINYNNLSFCNNYIISGNETLATLIGNNPTTLVEPNFTLV